MVDASAPTCTRQMYHEIWAVYRRLGHESRGWFVEVGEADAGRAMSDAAQENAADPIV